MAKEKSKTRAHHEKDPAAIAADAKKDAKADKTPKTVKARCVLGFRVNRDESVAPGETVELPYRDFTALELAGKVIAEADAPKKAKK